MQLDPETIRWLLSGFFIIGGGIISLLMNRELRRMDQTAGDLSDRLDASTADHAANISSVSTRLANYKLHVSETYVSKTDLEKQLNAHLNPIRENMRELKGDMSELKGDVKALLSRP